MGAYVALVVGALGLITLPTHVATYRERGVLRRFDASTIPRQTIIGAQTVVMIALSAIGAALVVTVGVLVYHPRLPASWPLVILNFVLAALAFAMIGSLLGLVVPTARAAQGIGIMLWFVMLILGGSGPPPEVLPDAMNAVGALTPLRHAAFLIQDAWLGFGWNAYESAVVGGFFVVSLALTAIVLRRRTAR
jgi:ABC-2 type transport system permease protein